MQILRSFENGRLTHRRGDAEHRPKAEAPPRPYNRNAGHFHGFWVPVSRRTAAQGTHEGRPYNAFRAAHGICTQDNNAG